MKILLYVYLFFVLLGLPCYVYLMYSMLKELLIDVVDSIKSDKELSSALIRTLISLLEGLIVVSFAIPFFTLALLVPIVNLFIFTAYDCDIKNPFYKNQKQE